MFPPSRREEPMRRLNILPQELRDPGAPAQPDQAPSAPEPPTVPGITPLLQMTVDLEAITPIVGGGAETRVPDAVEPVRVPSIRGALRDWWRAVGPETAAGEVYENEKSLWGGAGGDEDDGGDTATHSARASRVRLSVVRVDNRGKDRPAGHYDAKRNGRLSTLPDWRFGRQNNVGYALFPLQRDQDERRAAERRSGELNTPDVREKLRFTLRIEVVSYPEDREEESARREDGPHQASAKPGSERWLVETAIPRLLAALRAWILFGGLGARTTRGFGSLRAHTLDVDRTRTRPDVLERIDPWLREALSGKRFRYPASRADRREVRAFFDWSAGLPGMGASSRTSASPASSVRPWPSLSGATLVLGPPSRSDPVGALRAILGLLWEFRQGPGTGRKRPAHGNQPGRSYWPEPDAMKTAWEANTGNDWNQDLARSRDKGHPKAQDTRAVPRAAFGMPLNVSFHYQHRFDQGADGSIVPPDGKGGTLERFRSPVRLGVLPCSDGAYIPFALVLTVERPDPVIKQGNRAVGAKLLAPGGVAAQPPIRGHLARAGGDAVLAWVRYLEQQGYQAVSLLGKGGKR